jgi:hypothetical protein
MRMSTYKKLRQNFKANYNETMANYFNRLSLYLEENKIKELSR